MASDSNTFRSWAYEDQGLPDNFSARVYFAYAIQVNGTRVGTFQTFNPQSTRQVLRVRGIANNRGFPFELVPGPADLSFTVNFLALYRMPLASALGYSFGSVVDLNYYLSTFSVDEICHFPGTDSNRVELVKYKGCQIRQMSRTINQGTIQVVENATIDAAKSEENTAADVVFSVSTLGGPSEGGAVAPVTPPYGTYI